MRTISVTSGKGGVGKTNLSANIGIALADRGKRVILFDADLGLANLDVVLGTKAPFTLQSVLSGEKRLQDVVAPGPGGIRFIAGGSGVEALVNLNGSQLDRFLTELAELERTCDVLIFDTGAGIDGNVMTFLQASDETLLISTPDPASITDAYATAKTLLAKKPEACVRVVLNMVADEAQAKAVFAKLQTIAQQFLDKTLVYGGYVRQDARAVGWIRQRRPFFVADSTLLASQDVMAVAARLLGQRYEAEPESLADRLRSVFSFGLRKSA